MQTKKTHKSRQFSSHRASSYHDALFQHLKGFIELSPNSIETSTTSSCTILLNNIGTRSTSSCRRFTSIQHPTQPHKTATFSSKAWPCQNLVWGVAQECGLVQALVALALTG